MSRPTDGKHEIVNDLGLHARAASKFVRVANDFEAEVWLGHGGREVNGKSILELMTLNASEGTELEVRAWGGDAEALLGELEALVKTGFGEEIAS